MSRWITIAALLMGVWSGVNAEISGGKATAALWKLYSDALRGDKVAQFQVGVVYERGLGVEQNQTMAAQWYEKSAIQGHVDAQYNIAIMYASGRGVAVDEDAAIKWLARAAKQGDTEARKLLLGLIDKAVESNAIKNSAEPSESDAIVEIKPVTLIAHEGAEVCAQNKPCVTYKAKTIFTSNAMRGRYYKVSGIGTNKGWQAYADEGWIEQNSVSIRR